MGLFEKTSLAKIGNLLFYIFGVAEGKAKQSYAGLKAKSRLSCEYI
jgi:hypothetical protein